MIAVLMMGCHKPNNQPVTETICQEKFHCDQEIKPEKHLVEIQDSTGAMYLTTRADDQYQTLYMSVNSNDPNLAYAADLKSYKISVSYPLNKKKFIKDKISVYVQTFCKCDEAGVVKVDDFDVSIKKINAETYYYLKSKAFNFLQQQTLVVAD